MRHANYRFASAEALGRNLLNTEVDIVLESSRRLYIGEAKYLSGFGADGRLVLVHQLIRQFVMARALVDVADKNVDVVPFVVVMDHGNARRSDQIRFMIDRGWMAESHILTWDEVTALAATTADAPGE